MWTNDYVGLPWRERGRDREGLDCWGLVRLVLAEQRGIDLPSYAGDYASTEERAEIAALIAGRSSGMVEPVAAGAERPFDLIQLRDGDAPTHIGLVVAAGDMLHIPRRRAAVVVPCTARRSGAAAWSGSGVCPEAGMPLDGARLIQGGPEHRVDTVGLAGQTIAEMIAGANGGRLDPVMMAHGRVLIGDQVIPATLWHRVRPKAGSVVVFRLVPQGGNVLRIVLTLAVVVAAAYLGPVIAGALPLVGAAGTASFGIASALATGVITFAGSLLLNALIPQRLPTLNTRQPSPTYSISGARNSASPWGVVPAVLGRHRMSPLYAARPYTEIVGQDQYLRLAFLWGYGPLRIEDRRIGETLETDFDDIEIEHREGLPGDAPLTLYPGRGRSRKRCRSTWTTTRNGTPGAPRTTPTRSRSISASRKELVQVRPEEGHAQGHVGRVRDPGAARRRRDLGCDPDAGR